MSDQPVNQRRGPAHRRQHRQAAGVGAAPAVLGHVRPIDRFRVLALRSLLHPITRSEAIVRAARLELAVVIFMPSGVKATTK